MRLRTSALAGLALLAVSCALAPVRRVGDHLPGDPFWPRWAGQRITYVGELKVPADLGIQPGVWARLWALVAGGPESRALYRPFGVAVAPDGRVAVADPGRHVVRVYEPGQSRNRVLTLTEGLTSPVAVAFAGSTVWVADAATSSVLAFDGDGRPVTPQVKLPTLGQPAGLAVDARRGRLYIVDSARHRVHVVQLNGRRPSSFGGWGTELGQLNRPTAIALDRQGQIFINDSKNYRVQIFGPDLQPVSAFGERGSRPGQMSKCRGVAVGRDGIVYVAEGYYDVVQAFTPTGQFLGIIGGSGGEPGRFSLPTGMAVDGSDRLFVADAWNSRVQVFALDARDPPKLPQVAAEPAPRTVRD